MPATSKGYAAEDDADTSSRTLAQREEEAIAHFLEKTDRLLSIVVAALVIWLGLLVINGPVRAQPQNNNSNVERNSGERIWPPGMSFTTTPESATTSS